MKLARLSGLGFFVCFLLLAASAVGGRLVAAAPIEGHPFAPRSGPRTATLFAPVPETRSGVVAENRYADPRMWGDRYQEFTLGAIGTGVAMADFDGDGRPDIFVVNKTESCRLFRNLGGWKFADVTDVAGVADVGPAAAIWKQGVAVADVNNDGWLDLYVCRFAAPNLLYLNQGNGTFKEQAAACHLDLNDASNAAAFCDYDRDGWLDVYVQTNLLDHVAQPGGRADHLYHNNGDGTFTDVTAVAGLTEAEKQGHSVAWWDYDNDGWPDLYAANDFESPDFLYRNNRNGTFTNVIDHVVPHMPFSSMGSDTGDVDNDGRIDLLVADMAATTHVKDHRGMAASRAGARDDSDQPAVAPQSSYNALYLNTGRGRVLEAAALAGLSRTDWTWSVRFEDLDNDGRLDAHFTNGMNRELHNSDLLVRMMGAESAAARVALMKSSPIFAETNLAFRNLGHLQFENVAMAWGLDQKGVSFGAAFGDLDDDGDLDLVFTNYQGNVTLLRNDSDSGHRLMVDLRGTISNRFGVGAVVRVETSAGTQVRELQPARGYMSASEPAVHFGLGEESVVRRLTVTWPSGVVQSAEDLPADRRYTFTEPAGPPTAPKAPPPGVAPQFVPAGDAANLTLTSHEEPVDEIHLQRLIPVRLNRRGPALAVGSVDALERNTVVLGGTTHDGLRLMRDDGSGHFSGATMPAGPVNDGPVLLFDANGDGSNDLLVTKGGNAQPAGAPEYQPQLFLNDGKGGFSPAPAGTLPALALNVGAACAADFQRDGTLGVFLGGRVATGDYPQPPESALLVNRGGKFADVTDTVAPGLRRVGMVTSALWTDVDGDGWVDLVLALEWGRVTCFRNHEGRNFTDETDRLGFGAAGVGWWNSIAAADFNGDGRPDYAVGNLGLNTIYQASATQPALLFAGDFKGNGEIQLLEAVAEDGKLYPRRSRKDLGVVFPTLLKRYPRSDVFARATLGEIFGEDKLAAARRFAATELRSGVFLSQPDGTFRFAPFPRVAQIAPLQGIAAGDFDGDGHADVYAVQNSFAPIASVGRFDGGLSQLLRGDGRGNFAPVPVAESGLEVSGDAKALAVFDLDHDGWADFLVSRNNGDTLAFRNRGVAGHRPLRVALRGAAGNPTAVGARVSVEFADGSTQVGETAAGSGHASQSDGALYFGYPEKNPPRAVQVRWPRGEVTRCEVSGAPSALVISPAGVEP